MARRKGALERAGFERVEGDARRRYIDPSGRNVSYREAFRRSHPDLTATDPETGRTVRGLEAATLKRGGRGTFREPNRLAFQVRTAARNGLLSEAGLATRDEEKRLSKATVRGLLKGHYPSEATKAGIRHERVPETAEFGLFRRLVLDRLQTDVRVERRPGEPFADYMGRVRGARYSPRGQSLVGPRSDKAVLLTVLNRRAPEAEYSVGDTP